MRLSFNLKRKNNFTAHTYYGNKREMKYVDLTRKTIKSPVVDKYFSGLKSSVCTDDFGVYMISSFDLLRSNLKVDRQF